MEALDQTQRVIDWLESDIMHADYRETERLTGIPLGLYQRIFAYLCDVSLSGYVRKRRLTLAAQMLLAGERSVTEAALDCGYESPSSFTRAFKELFGTPPALITFDVYRERAYPPLALRDNDSYYVWKGRRMMADVVRLDYEETEEALLIGIGSKEFGVTTHELWGVYFGQGFDRRLAELDGRTADMDDCIGVGFMTDFADESGLGNTYMIGKLFRPGTPVPEGMASRVMQGGTTVRAQVSGRNLDDILASSYILLSQAVQKNGYALVHDPFYWMEWYTVSRYASALEQGSPQVILDWRMPCRKI